MKRKASRKKIYGIIAVIVALVLAVGAWLGLSKSSSSQSTESSQSSSLNYAFGSNPVSINPINSNDLWGLKTVNMVYSPLARTNNDGSVTYELATDIKQSEDGKSITVKLRDDVKWSDGEQFNADDVVFTYTQKAKKENGKYESLWIGDAPMTAKKVDDYTVEFDLPSASAAAVNNITNETYILPEHVYKDTSDFSVNDLGVFPTVGTGPYVLEKFVSGDSLTFKANENYYGGKPAIDSINVKIIENSDTIKVALQKGEIDLASINSTDVDDFKGTDVTTETYSAGGINYLGINSQVITDSRVRQAIFYALDRDQINQGVFTSKDFYQTATSFLPSDNAFYDKSTPDYAQNIDKAKSLLKEAGASNLSFTLAYDASNDAFVKEAAIIQEELAEVGITVNLQAGDGDTILAELKTEGTTKYPLFLRAYSMGNDPDTYKRLFQTGGASNYFKLADSSIDALFTKGATTLDETDRKTVYKDLQVQLAETAVIYPISSDNGILAVNKRVTGIETSNLYPIYTIGDWSKVKLAD
ncbi:ABC transporter substrate-binding protein [Streptococcus loxodontisalivarius]|uniref:Peptide/nickel transport system substrate-binding protein n=1 Tax=Streptococcus loxodontisalivarius TaxID=1349415 RepID=A0ABS2PU88_9STRE|nr:ABC transporter substrate-binding protein [Streptococcus loxodontisalivarius]MBM7642907.1 peptide/nickel transport system substrate-binding protein [Streptococcus loxodontisalivarius]